LIVKNRDENKIFKGNPLQGHCTAQLSESRAPPLPPRVRGIALWLLSSDDELAADGGIPCLSMEEELGPDGESPGLRSEAELPVPDASCICRFIIDRRRASTVAQVWVHLNSGGNLAEKMACARSMWVAAARRSPHASSARARLASAVKERGIRASIRARVWSRLLFNSPGASSACVGSKRL
jgi:hypothetical protein